MIEEYEAKEKTFEKGVLSDKEASLVSMIEDINVEIGDLVEKQDDLRQLLLTEMETRKTREASENV